MRQYTLIQFLDPVILSGYTCYPPFGLVVGIRPTVGGDIRLNNQSLLFLFVCISIIISLPLLSFVLFV